MRERVLVDRGGVRLVDVVCRHRPGESTWATETHPAQSASVVFVRGGSFVRQVDGVERVVDPVGVFCISPGQQHGFEHRTTDGDDCTSIQVPATLLPVLASGASSLPPAPLPSAPELDLRHRLLLSAARRGDDPGELADVALVLAADAVAGPERVDGVRHATSRTSRVLADDARQALTEDPARTLTDLALLLAVSPSHLSRAFSAETGHTLSRHRIRLRVRAALDRLAAGEPDLAALAAQFGFADQAHLSRAVRDETGRTPSALRQALAS